MAKKPASPPSRPQRARAHQQQLERRERAGKVALVGGAAVLAVVLVVALFLVLRSSDTTGQAADAVPANTNDDYGVVLGDSDAPKTVTVYEDFQCPICAQFEQLTGDQLEQGLEEGTIQLELRMVSFLDQASSNEYSSRAMNAALAVLDTAGPEAFKEFHDQLFAEQPAEGGPGPENAQLIETAVEAGADEGEITPQIEDKVYAQWIENATDAMSENDVTGTPTVLIDGEKVDGVDEGAQAAIEAAQGGEQ